MYLLVMVRYMTETATVVLEAFEVLLDLLCHKLPSLREEILVIRSFHLEDPLGDAVRLQVGAKSLGVGDVAEVALS